MSNRQDVVSKDGAADQGTRTGSAGEEPEVRSREEVAREIGTTPSGTDKGASSRQELEESGPLRLDKSGALAGRPKLKPVKAHRKPAAEAPRRPVAGDGPEDTPAAVTREAAGTAEEERPVAASSPRPMARARKASLPPRIGTLRPEGAAAERVEAAEEIAIPAGPFLYGESRARRELGAYRIDRRPVTNADYETFVTATGHRRPLYWPAAGLPPELATHPVVGVDYYDALAYAQWKGKDLPYEDEWERAARGVDGRTYPWGNDQELSGANTARVGLKMTVPYDLQRENVSPEGCRDMVGNAWEITHSPAPGGGVVVRGGSWYDFALYAKTYFRFASQPDARNGTIGFRCCRRESPRTDAAREVDDVQAVAEIATRRASQPPVDRHGWSAERRDLVIDLPRLRTFVAEARAEALLGAASPRPQQAQPPKAQPPKAQPPKAPPHKPTLRTIAPVAEEAAPQDGWAPDEAERAAPLRDAQPLVVATAPASASEAAAPEAAGPEAAGPEAARPEAAGESAPAESPLPPPRIHIGSGPLVSRAAAPGPAGRGPAPTGPAAKSAARARSPASRSAASRSMPIALWVLLGAGFLLFGGLLVMLVNRDSGEGPGLEPEVVGLGGPGLVDDGLPRSPLADLPDMPDYDAFPWSGEPAQVIDAADRADVARLDRGSWILIFVDPAAADAPRSLQAAHALHRRLATHNVRVGVVLPRVRYQDADGALRSPDEVRAQLEEDGSRRVGGNSLWDGLPVVLEPADSSGRGLLRLRTKSATQGSSAVLLSGGLLESRSTPPEGGFTEASLVGLAKRALDR